jgi:hypothetical protein
MPSRSANSATILATHAGTSGESLTLNSFPSPLVDDVHLAPGADHQVGTAQEDEADRAVPAHHSAVHEHAVAGVSLAPVLHASMTLANPARPFPAPTEGYCLSATLLGLYVQGYPPVTKSTGSLGGVIEELEDWT